MNSIKVVKNSKTAENLLYWANYRNRPFTIVTKLALKRKKIIKTQKNNELSQN